MRFLYTVTHTAIFLFFSMMNSAWYIIGRLNFKRESMHTCKMQLLRDWRAWRSSPNAVSLVTYFYHYMNFSLTKSATTLKNFTGTAFLLPLVGGFICDIYFSRFKTCVLFASIELLVRTYLRMHVYSSITVFFTH